MASDRYDVEAEARALNGCLRNDGSILCGGIACCGGPCTDGLERAETALRAAYEAGAEQMLERISNALGALGEGVMAVHDVRRFMREAMAEGRGRDE